MIFCIAIISVERICKCCPSSFPNPKSENTLPLDRVTLVVCVFMFHLDRGVARDTSCGGVVREGPQCRTRRANPEEVFHPCPLYRFLYMTSPVRRALHRSRDRAPCVRDVCMTQECCDRTEPGWPIPTMSSSPMRALTGSRCAAWLRTCTSLG